MMLFKMYFELTLISNKKKIPDNTKNSLTFHGLFQYQCLITGGIDDNGASPDSSSWLSLFHTESTVSSLRFNESISSQQAPVSPCLSQLQQF